MVAEPTLEQQLENAFRGPHPSALALANRAVDDAKATSENQWVGISENNSMRKSLLANRDDALRALPGLREQAEATRIAVEHAEKVGLDARKAFDGEHRVRADEAHARHAELVKQLDAARVAESAAGEACDKAEALYTDDRTGPDSSARWKSLAAAREALSKAQTVTRVLATREDVARRERDHLATEVHRQRIAAVEQYCDLHSMLERARPALVALTKLHIEAAPYLAALEQIEFANSMAQQLAAESHDALNDGKSVHTELDAMRFEMVRNLGATVASMYCGTPRHAYVPAMVDRDLLVLAKPIMRDVARSLPRSVDASPPVVTTIEAVAQ